MDPWVVEDKTEFRLGHRFAFKDCCPESGFKSEMINHGLYGHTLRVDHNPLIHAFEE